MSRNSCNIFLDVSCLTLAGTGLLPLLAAAYGRVEPFAAAASSLISLSIGVGILERENRRKEVFLSTLIIGISWILALTPRELSAIISITLAFTGTAYVSWIAGYETGIAFFSTSFVPFLSLFSWSPASIVIASIGYTVMAGLIAASAAKVRHPLVISFSAPFIALLGVEGALAASTIAYMLAISVARATERIGCPFSIDSGLLFAGSLIGGLGAVLLGKMVAVAAIGVWALGFILQLAGVLIPSQQH